ncbi:MAG: hypothetical protein JHC38_04120 [Thiotrichales bacterium]|nr:hypothetical protein [Thiotrichales bacterium]
MTTWIVDGKEYELTPEVFKQHLAHTSELTKAAIDWAQTLRTAQETSSETFRLTPEESVKLCDVLSISIDTEYLQVDVPIDDIIAQLQSIKDNLDKDRTIVYYRAEFSPIGDDYTISVATYHIMSDENITRNIIRDRRNYLKNCLAKAIKPQKGFISRTIDCAVLDLWVNGSIDLKAVQQITYGVCEV